MTDIILEGNSILISLSLLRLHKVYSPLFDTYFDLMTDEQCKQQLDVWFENMYNFESYAKWGEVGK